MAPVIRCVHNAGALLGEGPVWVESHQALFWTDVHGHRVHRYDPITDATSSFEVPFRIGSLAPRSSGGFVGGCDRGLFLADRELAHLEVLADPEPDLPGNRFNDGKVDPHGHFWAGTMDNAEEACSGSLYRLDADLRWSLQDVGYKVPNGPTFSPDGRIMYHTDSPSRTVYRFELTETGKLQGKSLFARFEPSRGHPDGMTTDREGRLWIAFWDGWCIRQLSPAGKILQTINLPVERPTSCAFGGERLDILFVTSATVGLSPATLKTQPHAGGLFAIEGLGQGTPMTSFPG